jgi:hypothetical protein
MTPMLFFMAGLLRAVAPAPWATATSSRIALE